MSLTAMTSPMNLRLTSSSMPARAGPRQERTTSRWRFPPANPVTREYASDASTAARSTSTGYQTNFPICRDAGVHRGLNYLAIGDTHSFRDVTETFVRPDRISRCA